MRYVVDVAGERVAVDLEQGVARVGDRAVPARLERVAGTPVVLLHLGDAVHRLVVQRGTARGHWTVRAGAHQLAVEALDERGRAIADLAAAHAGPAGPEAVTAPMPGLVVKVLVQPGDEVVAGQGVVVMEAMKMENELRAAAAGRVAQVRTSPGAAVERGALLVEFEAP